MGYRNAVIYKPYKTLKKLLSLFYINKKNKDGHDYLCIVCRENYQNDYY